MLSTLFGWLARHADYGVIFVRVIFGCHLVHGTQDNVFDHERMVEFQRFIASHGFPFPVAGAYISAYAQFICGILYLAGAAIRPAAMVMIVNFLFALGIAHRQTPLQADFLPLEQLAVACFLLFNGAGPWSVDARVTSRTGYDRLTRPHRPLPQ